MQRLSLILLIAALCPLAGLTAEITAVTDYTNYNTGSEVRMRLEPGGDVTAKIRYAGEENPLATGIRIHGPEYSNF